ncbi:FecR family protein [Parvibaculum sp.]|uniref:FecR family protein n=1 Tax=Parvibaculum sp. TaxID=2024848 RepID=UPI00320DEF2D
MTSSFADSGLRKFLAALSLIAGALVAQPALADAPAKAGIAATIRNDVQQSSTTGSVRALLSGGAVFQNDVVRTGKTGSAELKFLDETSLKVAPGSEVKIDKFVYDPNRTAGTVAITVAKGALRFVTGNQDKSAYKINTAVASIGVRGTILNIVATDQGLAVILSEGKAMVTGSDGKTAAMEAVGNLVLIGPDGTATTQAASLKDAVAQLIKGSEDPARTAAQLLAAIGAVGDAATAQNLQDIAAGVSEAGVSAADLAQAVSDYVQGAVDQASTAGDIINGAKYLNDDLKGGTGKGLAQAADVIGKTDPTTAGAIAGAVEGSNDPALQNAYKAEPTNGIQPGGDNLLQNQQNQQDTQSPN